MKLNKVFFPNSSSQARSLGCGFARMGDGDIGALGNPLTRVSNQTTRRSAAFSATAAAVHPCLAETPHFDTQITGQKSHCVSTLRGHRNALSQ